MVGVKCYVAAPVSLYYLYVSSDSMSNTVQFRATRVLLDISFGLLCVFLTNIPPLCILLSRVKFGKGIKNLAGWYRCWGLIQTLSPLTVNVSYYVVRIEFTAFHPTFWVSHSLRELTYSRIKLYYFAPS